MLFVSSKQRGRGVFPSHLGIPQCSPNGASETPLRLSNRGSHQRKGVVESGDKVVDVFQPN
jgi:hypothetical protein